jgi:hypothetical protein
MTLEEMRAAIKRQCNGTPCAICPLYHNGDGFCADYKPGEESKLIKHYRMMFGEKSDEELINVGLTKAQIEHLIYLMDATLVKQIRDTDHRIDVKVLYETTSAYMELKKAVEQ